jgi:hypothetical protein
MRETLYTYRVVASPEVVPGRVACRLCLDLQQLHDAVKEAVDGLEPGVLAVVDGAETTLVPERGK